MAFYDKMLRKIFGLKREKAAGDQTELQRGNEDLHNFYFLPNITRKEFEMLRNVAIWGK
jgi:hypothetical protein